MQKDNQYWKDKLSEEEYRILREKGTEPRFSGKYLDHKKEGLYKCAACGEPLFSSETKYDSKSGWPSFTAPALSDSVEMREDIGHGMNRTEVLCRKCGGHLGHVFDDGPVEAGGKRFCVNSIALDFSTDSDREPNS